MKNKIEKAINLIKKAEPLALQLQEYGFHLAFSGGKDSQVIYELCKMAGVKFRPVMCITTIDHPELMRFIRENYPEVIFDRPKINFYKLIIQQKILPTRNIRYCCKYLKERSGVGAVTITGIRRCESSRRSKRSEIEFYRHKYANSFDQFNIDRENLTVCIDGKDKIILSPILDWTTKDVWQFIREKKLKYCELYDKGYSRIGCMFCPMAPRKINNLDRKNYPKVEREIKKSIKKLIEIGKYKPFNGDVDDIFNWWISKLSIEKYKALKTQYKIWE